MQGGENTPVGPLITALRQALGGLSRGSEARARYALSHREGTGSLKLSGLNATSVSGARLAMQGEAPGMGDSAGSGERLQQVLYRIGNHLDIR